jgi:hypothetical protein
VTRKKIWAGPWALELSRGPPSRGQPDGPPDHARGTLRGTAACISASTADSCSQKFERAEALSSGLPIFVDNQDPVVKDGIFVEDLFFAESLGSGRKDLGRLFFSQLNLHPTALLSHNYHGDASWR